MGDGLGGVKCGGECGWEVRERRKGDQRKGKGREGKGINDARKVFFVSHYFLEGVMDEEGLFEGGLGLRNEIESCWVLFEKSEFKRFVENFMGD